jgi:penicillin-binding protein 2
MFAKKRGTIKRLTQEIQPDEVLLDIHNSPGFNRYQMEGRLEAPIEKKTLYRFFVFTAIIFFLFIGRLFYLQVIYAERYTELSEKNSLSHRPLFAPRGVITDRNGVSLVWNRLEDGMPYPQRAYKKEGGFSILLGYVSYPAKDDKGFFWQAQTVGKGGVEQLFDQILKGKNGKVLVEKDVHNTVITENSIEPAQEGQNIELSIDADIQSALYEAISSVVEQSGYRGGAGVIMDIYTGELIAMTSYPEYSSQLVSDGKEKEIIEKYLKSNRKHFLNRVYQGAYTPGSIVKPFIALAALEENIISPSKQILSTGRIVIPNPYNPSQETIFRDNKEHGLTDMRRAIAVSSNVYFYTIGGGHSGQKGLGIAKIEEYLSYFGFGKPTGGFVGEKKGSIPSVAWKARTFPKDAVWRLGDTYNTSIGQYGFQVTPLQAVRAVGGIARKGTLVSPVLIKGQQGAEEIIPHSFSPESFQVVHEGMRMTVTEGTAQGLQNPQLSLVAKTGTAQISGNTRINSWVTGFYPYRNPRYAYAVLLEDGPIISLSAVTAFKSVVPVLVEKGIVD